MDGLSDSRQAGALTSRFQAELMEHFCVDQVGPLSASEALFVARRLAKIHALAHEDHDLHE